MNMGPRLRRSRTTRAFVAPIQELLRELREARALGPGPGHPSLRDYPLRRREGDLT
jgi:hypothetical protein